MAHTEMHRDDTNVIPIYFNGVCVCAIVECYLLYIKTLDVRHKNACLCFSRKQELNFLPRNKKLCSACTRPL